MNPKEPRQKGDIIRTPFASNSLEMNPFGVGGIEN